MVFGCSVSFSLRINCFSTTCLFSIGTYIRERIKRTKRPCAYYSNSSATFHCTLEGDLVFKLNPGPVNNGHCTQRRHASIDRWVLQSGRNPSNLIDVNNLSRGIPVISYRINDLPIRSPRCRNINNLRPVNRQPSEDRNTLRFCTINARSLNNKAGDFIDFICDYKPDIASITETWFHENESAARVLCTPAGYNLLDYSRTGRLGGGTGIMFRKDISVSQNAAGEFQSFEYSEWNITSRSHRFRLIIIYRPPYSDAHPITTGVFLAEFSDYLEHAVLCTDQLLICGDFNIHVDVSDDLDACRFLELLDSVGLDQHVSVPTHISGHTLDLIITRNSDQLLVSSPWTDYLFSDHLPVHCNIQVEKPLLKSKRISFRKLKSIDISSLRDDLSKSDLCSNAIDSLELNDLVTHYDEALSSALDRHAPLINKTVTKRPIVPWFNNEIKTAKRVRRSAERKWRKTKLHLDFLDYKAKKNRATFEMKKARQEFYTDFIAENSHDTRKLFRSAKTLFNHESELHFQGYSDSNATLANDIGNFIKKVDVIRTGLDTAAGNIHSADEMFPRNPEIHSLFQDFRTLTDKEVSSLITKATKKTCSLDPMPTTLVVECLDVLLPVLTKMINLSLQSGCFADRWKHADVHPKLKKPKAEVIFPSLRPISNLTFVSKLTECAAFSQTQNHLTIHDLYPKAQSSYRECHSTETALLRIKNDILMNMNRQHLTLLVLLDLSAAFDTVDHAILLNRLKSDFGISGNVLSWFKSYLYQRSQSVSINGHTSKKFEVKCGVPQGSCLGPLLFVLYASKLFTIIERHLPQVHAYADDTQLYAAFKPDPEHTANAVAAMEACINDIRKWMLADRLKIMMTKRNF